MTNNLLLVWILGADDPEMSAIEKLLVDRGARVAHAVDADGHRVHGGNAYTASQPFAAAADSVAKIVFVECCWDHSLDNFAGEIIHVDHHRRGDPGYDKPPAEFLSASSIGQVWMLLMHPGGGYFEPHFATGWVSRPNGKFGSQDPISGSSQCHSVPLDVILTAAADHCLAAYAGQCPGVDPDALLKFRIEIKAAYQYAKKCDVCGGNGGCIGEPQQYITDGAPCHCYLTLDECRDQILRDIESTTDALSVRQSEQAALPHDLRHGFTLVDLPLIVDMTDRFHPELPESACRLGVSYVATVSEPGGRVKDLLGGCTTPEIVGSWMSQMRAEGREVYGVPQRGYAGAYRAAVIE